ncbi:MAG: serine--tRNA ligase [Tenericutes bacterium]|nr:serine--tRNA ligase [Mycoplasmatota bacterium]
MIDIKLIRENKELVKENIKKKFQDEKLPLVDEIFDLDIEVRDAKLKGDNLRSEKNKLSSEIGNLMKNGEKAKAEEIKKKIGEMDAQIKILEISESKKNELIKEKMLLIPNIIADSVPIGKDDSENVELEKFGDPVVPNYEIPYHADIAISLDGLDKEGAGRTTGEGFYFLKGNIARLHSALLTYARDFMIDKGFTYVLPPFMIRSNVVNGVMSFTEKEAMMYKIEGEDLYLIGTSEHSMIGRFMNQIIKEEEFPITLTSYSPCFRKEGGAHGLEERGLYRVHQFEKEEMIVVCKKEDGMDWYNKMWSYTVEFFRSLNVPVRTLECCSGDLADLKEKSVDIEAWSPRQKAYYEVGSCSIMGDAQARRLGIRYKTSEGTKYPCTLNNTVVATPRGLIAVLENNYNEDGSVNVPEVLRPYMGGTEKLIPKK